MKNRINYADLDRKMIQMGFRENMLGTSMLRTAVETWRPGMAFTKELYPTVAKVHGSTPQRVERCMRHAIEGAFDRGDPVEIEVVFGSTVDPESGRPTNSEFISRMARVCKIED